MQVGNDIGNYTCNDCLSGKISKAEESECTDCIAGLYQPENGTGTCIPCESGTWSNKTGSSSLSNCYLCQKGTYSTAIGADLIKNVVVFVAVLPPPDVSDTNFTLAVTCAV